MHNKNLEINNISNKNITEVGELKQSIDKINQNFGNYKIDFKEKAVYIENELNNKINQIYTMEIDHKKIINEKENNILDLR